MEKIKQNYEEIIEVIFKVCYLLLTLATFITVIYASPIQPLLVKASLVLGMVLILIRVVKIRKYAKMPCVNRTFLQSNMCYPYATFHSDILPPWNEILLL